MRRTATLAALWMLGWCAPCLAGPYQDALAAYQASKGCD
jgi:hypothetical protein